MPSGDIEKMKVQIVLHGASRNADEYLDGWKEKAKQYGLIVLSLEYSNEQFSIGQHSQGMIQDTLGELNPPKKTLFYLTDQLFLFAKERLNFNQKTYIIFGHSAGGQFVNRFLQFNESPYMNKAVAANSGWYTYPTEKVAFPYGINGLVLGSIITITKHYSEDLLILLGTADTLRTTGMNQLMDLVNKYNFPIKYISPTHVGRSKPLFEQAIEFAKMGGMIDITTGASKYDEPYKQVLYALESGASIDQMTFSSDGNAGLSKIDSNGCQVLFKAPIDQNLAQVKLLIKNGGLHISEAIKLITSNPAKNLSLNHKGKIEVGADADFCFFNDELDLLEVIAKGKLMMVDGKTLPFNEV